MNINKSYFLNGLMSFALMFSFTTLLAQQSIEEVVVTATLKEQSELDTPISIDILTGETMIDNNIMTMFDISDRTPGINISKGTFSNKVYMRGVGSGGNQSFDQSVGQFVDGVYQGRSWTTAGVLLDMERVEILKGPQTTYFGNNAIGGALSFITKVPTDESEVSISATFGSHGEKTITAINSGRVSDGLKARFAISYHEMDGWLKNTNPAGDNYPNKDGFNMRTTLVWDSSDNMEVKLKIDLGRLDTASGMGWQQTNCLADGSGADITFIISTCKLGLGAPDFEGLFDDRFSASEGAYGHLDSDSIVLEIKKTLEIGELTSITSNQKIDAEIPGESDYSSRDFFHWLHDETSEQFSQELRLTSEATDNGQWMLGFYYQNTETANTMNIGRYYVAEWGASLGIGTANLALIRPMEIDDTTMSIFATRTFYLSEKLHLTAGIRHTDIDKDYIRTTTSLGINGTGYTFDDFNIKFSHKGSIADGTLQANSYSESATTPSLMLQYFKDENSMFYASYSDGFKSGGYEALGTALANNGAYESEGVDAYEIGYKTSSEKMKASMNYFNSKYDGNQLSSYIYPPDGGAPYNTISNVPSTNKGFELELSYLVSDSIIADLSFTKLDATYDDYAGGTCAVGVTPVAGTSSCDYTGLPLLYAADNSGLFSLTSENEMSNGMMRRSSISMYWTDDVWHNTDYDPNSKEDGFRKIDARIEFSKDDWKIAILGKNLTDEYTSNWNQQTNYTNQTGQFSILDRTRSIAVQFSKDF